jgi:hypothetical protein
MRPGSNVVLGVAGELAAVELGVGAEDDSGGGLAVLDEEHAAARNAKQARAETPMPGRVRSRAIHWIYDTRRLGGVLL